MTISCFAALSPKSELQPYEYKEPALQPHELLIEITHCGLCHSDIHLIDNDWNKSVYPLVPGHEIVGHIVKTGSSVSHLKVGERVGVSWQHGSCLNCDYCLEGNENICLQKTMTCVGRFGGFATKMVADSRFAFPIPKEIDSSLAAPLLCAGAAVFTPMIHSHIQGRHAIGVIGIGGLGHLGLQYAKALGCTVVAITRRKNKQKEAEGFGADEVICIENPGDVEKTTGKLDLILSTAPSAQDWVKVLSLLKQNGTLCFIGKPVEAVKVPAGLLTSSQKKITGSTVAPRWIMREMFRFSQRHGILPQIEQMPMKEINRAIGRLKKGDVRFRFVLTN
ncbi:MAG: NAD(P)-dependent alcohol dehydrogenase [Verrucomicrobia bacterium]|nr:NAD(P)-dependent alcohol dehydrogenase [Verrucomicrobiota bacterium]